MNQTTTEAEPTPQLSSKQKLLAFADAIDALERPQFDSALAHEILYVADQRLRFASIYIRDFFKYCL